MKKSSVIFSLFLLNACTMQHNSYSAKTFTPSEWSAKSAEQTPMIQQDSLKSWWTLFNDPILNQLVDQALKDSPDRLIANERIAEARGLKITRQSSLFPQLGVSATAGRENPDIDTASYPDQFYEAGFDASYEIDIFGRNRKNVSAANEQFLAAQQQYHDVSLSLVAEVTRIYFDHRAAQNQLRIAEKNLASQEKTLKLVENLYQYGSAPKLDVERAKNIANTTRASIPDFQRQAENARLRLSVLLGVLPEALPSLLADSTDLPEGNINSVLMAPAEVLKQRPDVRAAAHILASNSALTEAAIADIFPTFNISGFYGIADNALAGSISPWSVALGAAASILNFGRIEGQIDAAKAREKQTYELYRKTVIQAISDVEIALNDYAHIDEQRLSLMQAYESANKSLELSQVLFKEGEVAFLDVLDAQRTLNDAESALVSAKAAQIESLIRLYKSLGVY